MKLQFIPLTLAVVLVSLLVGCNKESSTQATGGDAKKSVVLKAKWPVGNRYVYRMQMDQHSTNKIPQMPKPVQQDTTMTMTYALSVLRETPDGGRELELEFTATDMQVKMGEQVVMSFDSKEKSENETQDPLMAAMRKIIGSKLHLLLNAEGKVASVVGVEEWKNNLALEDAGPGGQMLNQQFNEGFFRLLADFGRGFSPKPVSTGETWPFKMDFPSGSGKITVDAKITLKGWENHQAHPCAFLESQGVFSGTTGDETGPVGKMRIDRGKVSGRTWFDPELGAMIDSASDQSIRVKGQLQGRPGGGNGAAAVFTSDISQRITVQLVEVGKAKG